LLIAFFFTLPAVADDWKPLAPGIDYIDLENSLLTPWSHIHVFRVDLKQNNLDLVMAKALSQRHASVNEFALFSKALISINGGFFDRNYQPLGLRISHQKQHSPLKRISWWGIFYIKENRPYLTRLSQYDTSQTVDFAVQSGPRLIINNRIPSLKNGLAERSALGITPDKRVIILVTENNPVTTTTLAHVMQSSPLHCTHAMNLDGGSSSQLFAKMGYFNVNVHGLSNITDAIVVKPKQ
jgi:uncharacterized protein YigE (DUF2233 family)